MTERHVPRTHSPPRGSCLPVCQSSYSFAGELLRGWKAAAERLKKKIFLGCWNRETWQLHLCRLTSLLKSLYFRRFCSTKISEKSPPGALPPADNFPAKIRPGRGIRRPIKNQFVSKYLHNNAILRYFGETYLVLVSLRRSMMLQQRLEFAENGKKSNRCGQ